ncbi:MAG: hypothetical protein KAH32_01780 [Chlamydiia bacterium]|nr:hypothetical protein [Chlamydiia bacterium]
MKSKITYIYSQKRDYMEDGYVQLFKEEGIELRKGTKESFVELVKNNKKIQYDVETNVTDRYWDRELYVVQLGTYSGDVTHVLDYLDLGKTMRKYLVKLMSLKTKVFYAHNAQFEFLVTFKHLGVRLFAMEDTYLMSRLLTAGLTLTNSYDGKLEGFNGLKNQLLLRLGVEMDKGQQKLFDEEQMSPSGLLYAAKDVMYMGELADKLSAKLKERDMYKLTYQIERHAIAPIASMTMNGVRIDTVALDENIVEFTADELEARDEMNDAIRTVDEKTKAKLYAINAIQKKDEFLIKWTGYSTLRKLLKMVYPDNDVKSTAKKALFQLQEEVADPMFVTAIINKDYDKLISILLASYLEEVKAMDLFIKKGTINTNFNSNAQVLALFQIWYPKLTNVKEKSLSKITTSPIITAYKKRVKANKRLSSFGDKMYSYIDPDGRIRGRFTQLVPSGSRMSSSRPNLQQMPATESYRRIFIPRDGFKLVDSDYSSMEIFVAAALSKDERMLYAISKGYDMHSYSSSLIFEELWSEAEGGREPIGKPISKVGNKLRKFSKGLSFALFYGTGVAAFSETVGIVISEGKKLMAKYYETFPQLAAFFISSGKEALKLNKVTEPIFKRVRYFHKPKNGMEASHNKNAGMNFKPQAINGSATKYALALVYNYIRDNDLEDKVYIILAVHDQIVCDVREDVAEEWAVLQTKLMEKAALPILPDGEIKAESLILDHWTK